MSTSNHQIAAKAWNKILGNVVVCSCSPQQYEKAVAIIQSAIEVATKEGFAQGWHEACMMNLRESSAATAGEPYNSELATSMLNEGDFEGLAHEVGKPNKPAATEQGATAGKPIPPSHDKLHCICELCKAWRAERAPAAGESEGGPLSARGKQYEWKPVAGEQGAERAGSAKEWLLTGGGGMEDAEHATVSFHGLCDLLDAYLEDMTQQPVSAAQEWTITEYNGVTQVHTKDFWVGETSDPRVATVFKELVKLHNATLPRK